MGGQQEATAQAGITRPNVGRLRAETAPSLLNELQPPPGRHRAITTQRAHSQSQQLTLRLVRAESPRSQ